MTAILIKESKKQLKVTNGGDAKAGEKVLAGDEKVETSGKTYTPKWGYGTGTIPIDELHDNIGQNIGDDMGENVKAESAFKDITNELETMNIQARSSDKGDKQHILAETNLDGDDEDDNEDIPSDELPVFANGQNKYIFRKIKQMENKLHETRKATAEHTDRHNVMKEHTKHVQQELNYANHIVDAKSKEIQTEEHLHALADREKNRMNKEIKNYHGSKRSCQQKLSAIESDIFRVTQEIDSFKTAKNLNQNELDQWVKAAAKKEDDNLALRKYSRVDEVKIKDLNLTIEKLTTFSVTKRAEVENAITETQTKQTELDRTADAFKTQHNERRHLVKQWQDTIETMQARDKEISDLSVEYVKAKQVSEEKKQKLAQNKSKLVLQQADNEDITQMIEDAERSLQHRRNEQSECLKEQQEVTDERDSLKNELNAIENSLQQALTRNKGSDEQLRSKQESLKALVKQLDSTRIQLQVEQKETLTKEGTAKYTEDVISNREEKLKSSEKAIHSFKELMFKQRQQLASLRDNENLLESEIKSSQSQLKLLSSKIRELSSEGLRQKELVYNAEYQLHQMERKVARGLGERSDEEQRQLKARISELEADLNSHQMKRKALSQHYRKLQHELRSWIRRKEGNLTRQGKLQNDVADIEFEITSFELSLQEQVTNKEETMISHDTMRLDVRRLRDTLWNQTGEVQSLEAKRDQFLMSMAEKKRELKLESDIQSTKMRFAEEERHKNALELAQRRIVVEKLKAKFEVLRRGGFGGDNPESEHSQVHLLITMAQRREELQREGDNLDRKIREKQKEMRALDKTLAHLQDRNTRFRKSFAKVDMDSAEGRELAMLGDKIQLAKEKSFHLKSDIRRLQSEYEDGKQHLQTVNSNISSLGQKTRYLSETKKTDEGELKQSAAHVKIMMDEVQKLSFAHRQDAGYPIETFTPEEQLIRAKILQHSTKYLVGTLKELSKELNMKLPDLDNYYTKTIETT